ncbi:MAG: alpha/beta hydrolase [candidate division WOR-3 bacterium]
MLSFLFFFLSLLFLFFFIKYWEHVKIYRPKEDFFVYPSEFGIDFEDVNFSSRDHVLLNGWFFKGISKKVILFCHGNFGNISSGIEIVRELNLMRYNVFIFDYRGFGKSDGIPTERGLYYDALGAISYLRERGFKKNEIVLFGNSLGGAVAIFVGSVIRDLGGIIIDSTFQSIRSLSYDIFGFHFPRFLISNRFESIKRIKKIRAPKLIIHSEEDDLIPFYHGLKLFEEALPPKQFLKVKGFHNSSFSESKETYIKGIKHFIESL